MFLVITNRTAALILDAAYMIWLVPEVIYSFTRRARVNAKKADDGYSGAVIMACIGIGIFLAQAFARWQSQFSISWQPEVVFALGILIMILGVIFRWYAIQVLGEYFTFQLSTQPGQTIVQQGPYRFIRHPSYTGILITMFGLGLVFANWLSLAGLLAAGLIGYSYRAHVEEAALVRELGGAYREYMQSTKRFIPFIY